MSTSVVRSTEWMTMRAARSTLGIGLGTLRAMIADRRLTVRAVPGAPRIQLLRSEVEALLQQSIRPAVQVQQPE
jgi:hypothetical protein